MAKASRKTRRAARARRRTRKPGEQASSLSPTAQAVDQAPITAPLQAISKSFAVIALRLAPVRPKTVQDRARFLASLGLDKEEIAAVLGSTSRSIGELLRLGRRRAR